MRLIVPLLTISMFAALAPASAQSVDSATCIEGLSENGRLVYDAVAPNLPPVEGTAEDVIRSTARSMVTSGQLSRRDARPAVDEALLCLRLLGEQ